ncbi:hypothetical protein [Vibrio phage VP4B]|uniref:Uncharacterized protein n=1 Tax=Vibrio phage VP4B TaxID=1262540 RepID=V9LZ92_9CAUD|nr:hypothetical protein FDJ61_gp068 [Vibrio phage VP4B]AGB07182.1 hypothetical protein [Vibrio phage VP4B]
MYFVDTRGMTDSLLTFDAVGSTRVELSPYPTIIIEDVIVLYNSGDESNLYERIGHITKAMSNNLAVEQLYLSVYNGLKDYARSAGWDPRIMVKLSDYRGRDHSGEIVQLLIVMDLDMTMETRYDPFSPTTSLGEMISDNPTPDQMSNFIQS